MPSRLILVKHALPVLDAAAPAREWCLGVEGERQSKRLARALEQFLPFALVSSGEPKAFRTAEIVGDVLGLRVTRVQGLHEFDRPALPVMSASEHERVNAAIFDDLSQVVLGRESGAQALERFAAAVNRALEGAAGSETLVAIAHGTVISLFVAAYNDVSAHDLWKRLQCPSFVELSVPDFRLVRLEERAVREDAIR